MVFLTEADIIVTLPAFTLFDLAITLSKIILNRTAIYNAPLGNHH